VNFFDIDKIFFHAWDYPVSYLEFFGLVSGIVAVGLSSLANVWSWPLGIINVTLSFFLFFQVQLYPDMFLQIFFFITNVMGWWRWTHPEKFEEDRKHELKVSSCTPKDLMIIVVVGVIGTAGFGLFAGNLHELIPQLFTQPSAFPYVDSFITVMSIVATYYMIQKKIESWLIWLVIDVIATYLYYVRDIKLYSFLYFIYCLIAIFGYFNWIREKKSYTAAV
jgi:nicotinamide mononucleotide transporter